MNVTPLDTYQNTPVDHLDFNQPIDCCDNIAPNRWRIITKIFILTITSALSFALLLVGIQLNSKISTQDESYLPFSACWIPLACGMGWVARIMYNDRRREYTEILDDLRRNYSATSSEKLFLESSVD